LNSLGNGIPALSVNCTRIAFIRQSNAGIAIRVADIQIDRSGARAFPGRIGQRYVLVKEHTRLDKDHCDGQDDKDQSQGEL
jgi:hypothetical protein